MSQIVPVHSLSENEESSCKVLRLNKPSGSTEEVEAHRHNYFEILLFEKGGGDHMIDFDVHELHSTSLHFVSPGQIHALNRAVDVEGYVVIFTKEFMLLNGGNMSTLNDFPAFSKIVFPVLKVADLDFKELISMVEQMQVESGKFSALRESVLAAYINLLLIKCRALLIDSPDYKRNDESTMQLMQRFNALLEEHFSTLHKVNEYAELLNVTPNHLSDTIKKNTGHTAGELIHQRLILESKMLLLHSTISAKEVAYSLHFNDPSYFSRFFKANTGYSPEGFRKEIRKKYQH